MSDFFPEQETYVYMQTYNRLRRQLKISLSSLGSQLYVEEEENFITYSLEHEPDIFIKLGLVRDPVEPNKFLALALIMQISGFFKSVLDFQLIGSPSDLRFRLRSWGESILPGLSYTAGREVYDKDIANTLKQHANAFIKTITEKDTLMSILFRKAGVIDRDVDFIEEEIVVPWGKQKFRFALHSVGDKTIVLFDDIFGQNITSVTNAIESLAFHITQKYANKNYENLEWYQAFCFSPDLIIQKIQLQPRIEERKIAFIFKERRFVGYTSPVYSTVKSFTLPEASTIFAEFYSRYGQ